MKCNRHNFLSFWAIFALLLPLTARKMKIYKKNEKKKKTLGDIILHKCTEIMIIDYTVPEI